MKVYITTTVNFGDKPAGCIAIAAARETADRFGAEFPEAAWFLKFRTYSMWTMPLQEQTPWQG